MMVSEVDDEVAMVTDGTLRHMMPAGLGPRSEPINMSLLVIYLWLALVAIMIVITVIIFKYKQPVCPLGVLKYGRRFTRLYHCHHMSI